MKSHEYNFYPREAFKIVVRTALPLLIFAVAIRVFGMLATPLPILDIDRTILLHQAKYAREGLPNANIVLIGDSSCLMDVDASQLGTNVVNLGTLSYLDLDGYASLLRERSRHAKIDTVVLLMHPEALRLGSPDPYFAETLEAFYQGRDYCDPTTSRFACLLGLPIARGRFLARTPVALPGTHGHFYGFNHDLWDFLTAHQGSGIDPNDYAKIKPEGSAEYRLSAHVEECSKRFRAALPTGVRLIVATTPCPEGHVLPNHEKVMAQILEQWAALLGADVKLTKLPPTLPNQYFASVTHLNSEGQRVFTKILSSNLTTILR